MTGYRLKFFKDKVNIIFLDNDIKTIIKMDIKDKLNKGEYDELKRIMDVAKYRAAVVSRKLNTNTGYTVVEVPSEVNVVLPDISKYLAKNENATSSHSESNKANTYSKADTAPNAKERYAKPTEQYTRTQNPQQNYNPNSFTKYSYSPASQSTKSMPNNIKNIIRKVKNDSFSRQIFCIVIAFLGIGFVMLYMNGYLPESVNDTVTSFGQNLGMLAFALIGLVLFGTLLWNIAKFLFHLLMGILMIGAVVWFITYALQLWNNRF